MKIIVRFCFIISFVFLSSCSLSMSKKEKCQYVLPTPIVNKTIKIAFCQSTFTQGKWPSIEWWKKYKCEELNHLIIGALRENPTIQGILQRVELAKNEAIVYRSNLFPFVYFNASDSWEHLSKNGVYRALNPNISLNAHEIDLSLGFSYEFDFWGKYRNLYQAALGRKRAAVAESSQAKLMISTALAQAFFAYKSNLLRQNLYHKIYALRKEIFTLQKLMLKNAMYSKLRPLLSEEELYRAEQWVLDIDKEVEVSRHLINYLRGKGPDEPIVLKDPLPPLEKLLSIPEDISAELVARRPDLQAQIWRLEALSHEVGAAKAEFFPNVNILGLVGLEGFTWSDVFEWASRTVGLFPGVSLPIYTAGRISANVQGKTALFNEAVFEYNTLLLKSFQQVTDLIVIAHSTYVQKEKQDQMVKLSKERANLVLLRKKYGIDNAFESYKTIEEQLFTEIENVSLLYQQYAVSISLIKALGGGYICPEKKNG